MLGRHQIRAYRLSRGILPLAAAITLAACSTEIDRFSDYPPIGQQPSQAAPATSAPVARQPLKDDWRQTARRPEPVAQEKQTAPQEPEQPLQSAPQPPADGTLVVQSGQTLYSIARANGLTVDELSKANDIPPPYLLRAGQVITIPRMSDPVSPAVAQRAAPEAAAPVIHAVQPGETLFALGRLYKRDPYEIAAHNALSEPYHLRVGQRVKIPARREAGTGVSQAAAPAQPAKMAKTTSGPASDGAKPVQSAKVTSPKPPAAKKAAPAPVASPEGGFRWPVRGRVISAFGDKADGSRNEGINIAVPEGADIRAAEEGTVAYAGDELKDYGKLILIRHSGGWVSAYAHNQKLFVKRGDKVKRGDIVAKAGSTGKVTRPQLHFELRKGASAVDPMKYLAK